MNIFSCDLGGVCTVGLLVLTHIGVYFNNLQIILIIELDRLIFQSILTL